MFSKLRDINVLGTFLKFQNIAGLSMTPFIRLKSQKDNRGKYSPMLLDLSVLKRNVGNPTTASCSAPTVSKESLRQLATSMVTAGGVE